MNYHHIIQIQRNNGTVEYHRQVSDAFEPDYWEKWAKDYYKYDMHQTYSSVCINVYKGE